MIRIVDVRRISSEVALPFAGYLAARDEVSFWVARGAVTVGCMASARRDRL